MKVSEGQIFNLWDTNGRRSDVLNAIYLYLQILKNHKEQYPEDIWTTYPESLAQYRFYEDAISMSPEVFKKHENRDMLASWMEKHKVPFFSKDADWFEKEMQTSFAKKDKTYAAILDESIEQRARHYTSNLVRWGFSNEDREITQAGYAFLSGNTTRDLLEKLLPIDNTNLTLLRQAVKLRIYSDRINESGTYSYYSPFYMALYLLTNTETKYSTNEFLTIVQQTSPFFKGKYDLSQIISGDALMLELNQIKIPDKVSISDVLEESVFTEYFPNTKSGSAVSLYYKFYVLLSKIIISKDRTAVSELVELYNDPQNSSKLEQAFGRGGKMFSLTPKTTLEQLLEQMHEKGFLNVTDQIQLNSEIYKIFQCSKILDQVREYSDTTQRMLNATGIFSFSKLPEINFPTLIKTIFGQNLETRIFGESTPDEVISQDQYFSQNVGLQAILGLSTADTHDCSKQLCLKYNVDEDKLALVFQDQRNQEFIEHIRDKYSKEKVLELVNWFSDRSNDNKIKEFVNPAATVPTIYEFIIALSWYYISDGSFDLYNSLNLSLNGDYEPELHAGGGMGDIIIKEKEQITMLEVTLMNKQAQKRGEWEPVLRHAVNLTVESEPTPVTTFFVANELDYNTINIWRAVASVPLESSANGKRTSHVVIMPFKNEDIKQFLIRDVKSDRIIQFVKDSYDNIRSDFDEKWHDNIMRSILS